jgi:hypothetical protein
MFIDNTFIWWADYSFSMCRIPFDATHMGLLLWAPKLCVQQPDPFRLAHQSGLAQIPSICAHSMTSFARRGKSTPMPSTSPSGIKQLSAVDWKLYAGDVV